MTDTLTIDGVRVLTGSAQRAVADSAFRRAARVVRERLGESLRVALGDSIAFVGPALHSRAPLGLGWFSTPVGIGFGDPAARRNGYAVEFESAEVTALADRVLFTVASATHARTDRAMRRWVATAVPLKPFRDRDLRDDRRIVLAAGVASRECLTGDVRQCRAVVFDTTGASAALRGAVRASVVQFAVDIGGPGAWRRLIADSTASTPDRITAAARVPSDTVIARWSRALAGVRTDVALTDVLWVGLLLGTSLAITRRRPS
ncbi:MAG: hypothetical protein SFW08_01175 [Gemmatimonadaceae bacterium]|nr:hypothetical protein [Gemmatimonadaceae bacterium]